MPGDLERILQFLHQLMRRAILIVVLEFLLVCLTTFSALVLVAASLGALEISHPAGVATFWFLAFGIPLLWYFRVLWPLRLPFHHERSAARWVDDRSNEPWHLTLSALELAPTLSAPVGTSPSLTRATISQAAAHVGTLRTSVLLPSQPLAPWVGAFGLTVTLLLGVSGLYPEQMASWLHTFFSPRAPLEAVFAPPDSEDPSGPELGDISLTLSFPAYLERASETLSNSNGEIYAPLGTKVTLTARTTLPATSATLVLEASEPLPVLLESGGKLTAEFLVEREGPYRILFTQQGDAPPIPSRAYPIRVEPDGVPVVDVSGLENGMEISLREPLEFIYRAEDDHGVIRVDLLVEVPGATRRQTIKSVSPASEADQGAVTWYPSEWSLPDQGMVELWLEAFDNDTVSGPKVGRSARFQLLIAGPERQQAKSMAAREAVKENLLEVLGDILLMDEAPLSQKTQETYRLELAQLLQGMNKVLSSIEETKAAMKANPLEELAVSRATLALFDEVAQSWETYQRGLQFRAGQSAAYTSFENRAYKETAEAFIATLERAILSLEQMVNQQRMDEVMAQADALRKAAESLEQLLADARKSGKAPDADALERLLDELEKKQAELAVKLSKLDRSASDWFQNPTGETQEMQSLMDEIRELLKQGKTEEAMAKLEEYLETTRELSKQLDEMMKEGFGTERNEMVKNMGEVIRGVEEVTRQQQRLLEDTQAVKEGLKQQVGLNDSQLESTFKQVLEKVEKLKKEADGVKSSLDNAGMPPGSVSQRLATELSDQVKTLEAALRAQDAARSMEGAAQAANDARHLEMEMALQRRRGQQGLEAVGQQAGQASDTAEQVVSDLDALLQRMEQMRSQGAAQGQGLASRQRSLQSKSSNLSQRLGEYSEGSSSIPSEWGERLKRASQSMGAAGEKLSGGELSGGEGDQALALKELEELQKDLEQAKQEMSQRQRSGQGQQQAGQRQSGESKEDWGHDGVKVGKVDIAKDYQAPEEYRRELMEGMKGEAPSRYEKLNREYYEKLVR